MKDLYSVLGTDVNSTPAEIREAYLKLSKKFHPDLNENDPYFENRFREIREAYEVLSDPVERAAYDNQLTKFRAYAPQLSAQPKKLTKGSINTKINWAFTAMLLMITGLFAYYVVRSVSHTKAPKVAAKSEVFAAAVMPHHKKHHHKKAFDVQMAVAKTPAKSKPFADTISERIVKPSLSKPLPPAVAVVAKPNVAPVIKPIAQTVVSQTKVTPAQSTAVVSAKPIQANTLKPTPVMTVANTTSANGDAYIKANATGVVYMRQMNTYNSDVVSVIPGDTKVAVLEKGSNFYKISYNNKTGYVPNWTVQFR